jgi:hypothetical protein
MEHWRAIALRTLTSHFTPKEGENQPLPAVLPVRWPLACKKSASGVYSGVMGTTLDALGNTQIIERRIIELKEEHRDLDLAIEALTEKPVHDELQLKRMKKRKLLLKDQISFLESQLTPDIPA